MLGWVIAVCGMHECVGALLATHTRSSTYCILGLSQSATMTEGEQPLMKESAVAANGISQHSRQVIQQNYQRPI